MSLKEALSVFGPGWKNPTLGDVEQLRESLFESSQSTLSAKSHDESEHTSFGSRRFVIAAGTGSQRECTGSDIHGCPTLPQVALQPASHSRSNSKFRLFSTDGSRLIVILTKVDLDGRSSMIKWIKPGDETDDYLSISRQQTTLIVTSPVLPTSQLLERLEHARKILTDSVASNPSSYPPPSPSGPGSLALNRRRRHQKPYIPRHLRDNSGSHRSSTNRWPVRLSCFLVACAVPALLVLWPAAPTEVASDRNRTSYAMRNLEAERRKILTVRATDFPRDVLYSTHWPPRTTEIEELAQKTFDFVIYALMMRELHVPFGTRNCLSRWLDDDVRDTYFDVYDVITVHAGWIMENGDVPRLYRVLVGNAYATMGLMDNMRSRTLCYVGRDIARDSFEFYLRLLHHLEYAAHVIVLKQYKKEPAFNTTEVLMRQATSLRSWLEERWILSEDSTCLKYALLQTPVNPINLLSQLPLQNYLFDPYLEHVKHITILLPWE